MNLSLEQIDVLIEALEGLEDYDGFTSDEQAVYDALVEARDAA
jgi:hypothetical protein